MLGLWSTEERKFINDKVDFVYDLVEEYVMYIINKAVDSLRQEVHHNTHTAILKPADDNISLSSSVISRKYFDRHYMYIPSIRIVSFSDFCSISCNVMLVNYIQV